MYILCIFYIWVCVYIHIYTDAVTYKNPHVVIVLLLHGWSRLMLQSSLQVLRIVPEASCCFLSFKVYTDRAELPFYLHALRAKAGWEMNSMQISAPRHIGTIEGSLYCEGCYCYGNSSLVPLKWKDENQMSVKGMCVTQTTQEQTTRLCHFSSHLKNISR